MEDVIKKPIGEAKAHLHEILKLVELEGREVVLTRHGKDCARIVPVAKKEKPQLMGFLRDIVSYGDGEQLEPGADAWEDIEVDGEKINLSE